jgi:hypothetical protein
VPILSGIWQPNKKFSMHDPRNEPTRHTRTKIADFGTVAKRSFWGMRSQAGAWQRGKKRWSRELCRSGASRECVPKPELGNEGEKRANVVVKKDPVEFAFAHDLRRSFCDRWANRVMPRVLQSLARHSTIVTTLTFYARHDAELTAEAVWDAMAQPVANTSTDSTASRLS